MIDIINCEFDSQSETPVFEINGTYNNESFRCRIELKFDDPEDLDGDFEHLDGVDLKSYGPDVLEELVNEIFETEEYQDARESREKD